MTYIENYTGQYTHVRHVKDGFQRYILPMNPSPTLRFIIVPAQFHIGKYFI